MTGPAVVGTPGTRPLGGPGAREVGGAGLVRDGPAVGAGLGLRVPG